MWGNGRPQLVLHAYLQRVVNSGGRIGCEYAVGRGRTDLLIERRPGAGDGPPHTRKYVIECKVRTAKVGLDRLIREGREQTAAYMDRCGAESGHVVIFDLRPGQSWEEPGIPEGSGAGRASDHGLGAVVSALAPRSFQPQPGEVDLGGMATLMTAGSGSFPLNGEHFAGGASPPRTATSTR